MIELSDYRKQSGFTLVELMITLVVAFIVIAAVYASYKVQMENEKGQQQVTQIQQNLRAAMDMVSREFPLAGYDPLTSGNYTIVAATRNSFVFTADLCEDGGETPNSPSCGTPESYDYSLYTTGLADDNDVLSLRRTPGGQAIADNIDQIEFRYLLNSGVYSLAPPPSQLDNIVGVQVTILARADEPDFNYTDNNTYTTLGGTVWNPANTTTFPYENSLNYRRRMLSKMIFLRNMGLF